MTNNLKESHAECLGLSVTNVFYFYMFQDRMPVLLYSFVYWIVAFKIFLYPPATYVNSTRNYLHIKAIIILYHILLFHSKYNQVSYPRAHHRLHRNQNPSVYVVSKYVSPWKRQAVFWHKIIQYKQCDRWMVYLNWCKLHNFLYKLEIYFHLGNFQWRKNTSWTLSLVSVQGNI